MSDWGAGGQPALRARTWRWRALLAFLVILGVLIGGYLTRRGTGELAFLASGMQEALAPVQARLAGALAGLSQRVNLLTHYWQVDSENQRLRQEIVRLQLELASLREARRENELLRQLLNMNAPPQYRAVSATIIGRSPRQWASQLIIDRGQDRAVDVGAVVVSTGGVVGRVVAATPSSARVLLITDPSSAVGGLVERTGDLVLVEGMPGSPTGLKARTLSPHAELKPGDVILTSGLGGVFPKGLPLGTVVEVKVDPYGLATAATVRPAADFGRMEYLLVLVPKQKPDSGKTVPSDRAPAGNPAAAGQAAPPVAGRSGTGTPPGPAGETSVSPRSQSGGSTGQTGALPRSGGQRDSAAPAPPGPATAAGEIAGSVAAPAAPLPAATVGDNAGPGAGRVQSEQVPEMTGGDGDGAAPAGPGTGVAH